MTLYLSTTLCEWNCECSASSWMGLSLVPGHGPWCFWSASMLGIVLCVLPSPNPRTARWGNVPTEIRVSAGPALTSISAFLVGIPMARQLLHSLPKREEHIENDCLRQSLTLPALTRLVCMDLTTNYYYLLDGAGITAWQLRFRRELHRLSLPHMQPQSVLCRPANVPRYGGRYRHPWKQQKTGCELDSHRLIP